MQRVVVTATLGLAALAFVGAAAPACTTSRPAEDPQAVLHGYARALEEGRAEDAYRMLSDDARRGISLEAFRRMLKDNPEEVKEIGRSLERPTAPPVVTATVTSPGGQELSLVLENGKWCVEATAIELYAQDSPRHAIQGFVRALERKRYGIIMKYVPEGHQEGLDAHKLKDAWEGHDKEEMEQVLAALKQALPTATIEETVYFVDLAVRAVRWEVLLASVGPISARRLYPVLAVGYMANNLLPGRIGELSRAYLVGRRENVSTTAVFATIAIERILDGLTVLVLLFVALFLLPNSAPQAGQLTTIANLAALVFGVALAGTVVLLVWRRFWVRQAARLFGALPSHYGDRLAVLLDRFISGLGALRDPRQIALMLVLSVLVWGVGASTYLLVGEAFNVTITPIGALATICAVNLVTAIPLAPAGLGAFEAGAEQMLILLGVSGTSAFGITIVIHAVIFVPVVIVGLFALWRMNLPLLATTLPPRKTEPA